MTLLESVNLVEILDAMGIKDKTGDFILGLEGKISAEEAAKRLLQALQERGNHVD